MNNSIFPFKPYPIQYKAIIHLIYNREISMMLFGGAARVSKSYLLAAYSIFMCVTYPRIHGAICRNRLTRLKASTLTVLLDVLDDYGFKEDRKIKENENIMKERIYSFNRSDNVMVFANGSKIFFLELYNKPDDPRYERISSMNLTFACIDEASEIEWEAVEALSMRLSYRVKYYNLIPKLLIVSNPTKGWLYDRFYKPYRDGTLPPDKMVILGTPLDNPTSGQEYIDYQMKNLSKPNIERMLKGNWEYDDEEYSLFSYDELQDAFYINLDNQRDEFYLSVDVAAGKGQDQSVIILWKGMEMMRVSMSNKIPTDLLVRKIKQEIADLKIKIKNVVIDSDGLGIGVANQLKGCKEFTANSRAFNNENYRNLKTQCIYKLAELVKNRSIKFDDRYKEMIIRELQIYKIEGIEKDGKTETTSKDEMKKNLGRSPDLSDAIMMRCVFLLKKENKLFIG